MPSDRTHYTSAVCTTKAVLIKGEMRRNWLEIQLVDERGEPLAHLPYRAVNEATRCELIAEFSGQSDAQGVIRLDVQYPLPLTLFLTANPLAEVLQTRRLRALRTESKTRRLVKDYPYDSPPAGSSPVEKQAQADGHAYHYLRIGQVCDRFPDLNPPLSQEDKKPGFHFPDMDFAGFTVPDDALNRRHVLEICPLRAWSLVLHHQPEYSMANAYNLGLMANLSYSDTVRKKSKLRPDTDARTQIGSVEEFFLRQCVDLSRTPVEVDYMPALVVDVPFDQRYTTAVMLDSLMVERTPGNTDIPRGVIENTQLFYAINQTQVLVAWRGTQEAKDWLTDAMYRPMAADGSGCDLKSACTPLTETGRVHYGFLHGFEVAKTLFAEHFENIQADLLTKKLFICGHSLGGALALIHSAELKDSNPLLYTYGMPRTFTAKALQSLTSITHFRHVNDADVITSVPPEADLDNRLYNLYGPLGYLLSALTLPAAKLTGYGDPYHHHGQIAMFYRANQHLASRGSSYPSHRNRDGLDAPYHNITLLRLPERTRIYLVPSLSDELSRFVLEEQKILIRSLERETLERSFPAHTNPERTTSRTSGSDHSMIGSYLPYLHNHLVELSAPELPMYRKEQRAKFVEQMRTPGIPEEERKRNQHFLDLQKLLVMAMRMTEDLEGGPEALQRFVSRAHDGLLIEITHA